MGDFKYPQTFMALGANAAAEPRMDATITSFILKSYLLII